ncbi:uncharacterized protein ACO6RY_18555 [Pungitius sinensis]
MRSKLSAEQTHARLEEHRWRGRRTTQLFSSKAPSRSSFPANRVHFIVVPRGRETNRTGGFTSMSSSVPVEL